MLNSAFETWKKGFFWYNETKTDLRGLNPSTTYLLESTIMTVKHGVGSFMGTWEHPRRKPDLSVCKFMKDLIKTIQ